MADLLPVPCQKVKSGGGEHTVSRIEDDFVASFAELVTPSPRNLADALSSVDLDVHQLSEFAGAPGVFPYGRRKLFASDHVEILVMNWASHRMCSPHDHGQSFGIVKVVQGEISHDLYTLDQRDRPEKYLSRIEREGTQYFAARGTIHAMGNMTDGPALTLHLYAPPITDMKVYDLVRCAVCVVSEDCGAWWPMEQRQILRQMMLQPLLPDRQ